MNSTYFARPDIEIIKGEEFVCKIYFFSRLLQTKWSYRVFNVETIFCMLSFLKLHGEINNRRRERKGRTLLAFLTVNR